MESTTNTPAEVIPTTADPIALQARIDALEQRIAEERTQHEAQLAELRINRMVTDGGAKKPASGLTATQTEILRDKAIRQAGGLARYQAIPAADRIKALGTDASEFTPEEIKEYFGSESSSAKANSLAKTVPAKYRRMRVAARELGIL
jgi:hypothetical protein